MARVLVLNNYSLERVWGEVKRKEKPDHHLYGINYFYKRGYQVEIVPFQSSALLQKIRRLIGKTHFPIPLGDLDQEWSALRSLKKGDLIFAPCQTQHHALRYLRAAGFVKAPIVCLAHHPLVRGRLAWLKDPVLRFSLRGIDAFPALSQKTANIVNQYSSPDRKSTPICWGPDKSFYSYPKNDQGVIIAAGRTGRDFGTFGLAVSKTNVRAQIICPQSCVTRTFNDFHSNVEIMAGLAEEHMDYKQLLEIYAKARALAIPLCRAESLLGLTSLMDAMGMGLPVIMTKNPCVDLIDIEKEGIGKWVDPGDVDGWREAIQWFADHKEEAKAMGDRARRLVDNGLNSESFADKIMDIFDRVLKR